MAQYPKAVYYYSFGKEKTLVPAAEFSSQAEAIKTALDRETVLVLHRYINGKRTLMEKLYDPHDNE